MSKRNEGRVALKDPNGDIFEVTQRNASDLVQHLGWTYVTPLLSVEDALATSPRDRKPRGSKMEEVRKKAAEEKVSEEKPAKGAKKSKKAKPVEVVAEDSDDDENVIPFDEREDVDAELAALEAEEDSRGNSGE